MPTLSCRKAVILGLPTERIRGKFNVANADLQAVIAKGVALVKTPAGVILAVGIGGFGAGDNVVAVVVIADDPNTTLAKADTSRGVETFHYDLLLRGSGDIFGNPAQGLLLGKVVTACVEF